jgi:hypothetical protein
VEQGGKSDIRTESSAFTPSNPENADYGHGSLVTSVCYGGKLTQSGVLVTFGTGKAYIALKHELHNHQQQNSPERTGKRVQVVLPLKVTYWDQEYKPCPDMACTYDISPRGARITGLKVVNQIGDIVAIERGRNKSFCRVVWVGEANSEFRGQVGIENVETERVMWETELRDLQEAYDVLPRECGNRVGKLASGDRNRRRDVRYIIEGAAEVGNKSMQGRTAPAILKDLSEVGCLLTSVQLFQPGTELSLTLSVADFDLKLRAQVRHANATEGMGLEFREIRKGDRQALRFLLRKLAEQELEQSFELVLQR